MESDRGEAGNTTNGGKDRFWELRKWGRRKLSAKDFGSGTLMFRKSPRGNRKLLKRDDRREEA